MAINRQNKNPLENFIRNIVRQTLTELGGQESDTQEFEVNAGGQSVGRGNYTRRRRGRTKGSVTNPAKDRRLKRNRQSEAET